VESTTQIFLRVQITDEEDDFVRGESLAGGYDDRIQIDSFSFGMESKLQAPRPGEGANVDLNAVQVTKFFDRSSTRLHALLRGDKPITGRALEERKPLHEVRITIDQQLEEAGIGKAQNAILVFHLLKARLTDIKLDVSGDARSTTIKETVSFVFKNFEVEYYYKSMKNNKKSDYRDKGRHFASLHYGDQQDDDE
jgi:type VI protein secretion system component Hcp